ncbi:retron Ec67 family RNA-directed DNA polymerase/endonuclease [Mesorhizobium amorphae]|uniref:RNA-directed DNA polymerase n=1 Tax=Mesorhizobium amorphae CCNWGS0123 TaxID=1082933 RepID=G6YBQ0_9HYPH|nr:retron Ec67 family RNA-directed DNA polymerase/endonuclease [Mesorhizobium amorphae]ANT49757.1 hypothetical protein A6B35_07295 [Mesorhizobium amorphae CCNWGS0123]EHH10891.1 ribonuclease H [Mesorhizobium amorphae CCNWGS0123]GLR40115.1 hypothetical protein GCM10007880_06310 [Mesorhizobium amorphae]
MTVKSLTLERLKKSTDLTEVAILLGVKPSALSHALYITPTAKKYHTFSIPKKRGGERIITAPNERLKLIQARLAALLLQIEQDLEATQSKSCILAHGFKNELSIITNAAKHRNRRFVFNVDLKDFFPSINFGRVRGFFMANRDFQLSEKAATILAQIACHQNKLPQGSPCSPPISNLIGQILDVHLNKLAKECRCTYTRYADDITFSTNQKKFPEKIAVLQAGSEHTWVPSDELSFRIIRAGFELNKQKTNMQYRDSRQTTTGLIVNQKLNVPVEYYKTVRATCHKLFTTGTAFRKLGSKLIPTTPPKIRGQLSFLFHIKGLETGHRKLPKPEMPNFYKLYAQFLNFMSFWAISQPTLVCEGKTDNIYIRSAIRALSAKFPDLVEKKDGKERIKLTFFKYTGIAKTIQDLSGGNGQLKNLVREYPGRTEKFKVQPAHPVIVVTDVDKGAVDLFKAVSDEVGKTILGHEQPWYFLRDNLYVVPVPKGAGAETAIEDLFDSALLTTEIDGKKFDRTNHEKDGDKFYSKFTFATKVISASKTPIDYGGFEPLLQAILDVQADYAARIAAPPVGTAAAAAS